MATPTFYVLHGDDEFSLRAQVKAMQDAMNDPNQMNTAILDGTSVSPKAAVNAVSAYPFLSDKRLVIVEGLLTHYTKRSGAKEALQTLSDDLATLPDFARLVFVEPKEVSAKNVILKLAQEHPKGYEKNFQAPKNPAGWITRQAKTEYNIEIDGRAAAALASVANNDLRVADSEIAKLAAFVNYERPITEQDVALLTPYVAEASIFDMVDALAEGNGKKAMALTIKLLNEGSEPLAILAMINRQFRLLIMAKEFVSGASLGESMPSALGVHPFVAKKLSAQVRSWNMPTLEGIYKKLAEYDYQIKTGQINDKVALQMFITGVTGS